MKMLNIFLFSILLLSVLLNSSCCLNAKLKLRGQYVKRGTRCLNDSHCGYYHCIIPSGYKVGKCK